MDVETGTEAAQFLSREYLFLIFGIVSLQCKSTRVSVPSSESGPPLAPSPLASVSPPWTQKGRSNTLLRVRGWGRGPNSDDWIESLAHIVYSVMERE